MTYCNTQLPDGDTCARIAGHHGDCRSLSVPPPPSYSSDGLGFPWTPMTDPERPSDHIVGQHYQEPIDYSRWYDRYIASPRRRDPLWGARREIRMTVMGIGAYLRIPAALRALESYRQNAREFPVREGDWSKAVVRHVTNLPDDERAAFIGRWNHPCHCGRDPLAPEPEERARHLADLRRWERE